MIAKLREINGTERHEETQVESPQINETEVLGQLFNSPKDSLAIAESMPDLQRARIAQFCYNKVHTRELGLRLAATCDLLTLKAAFGRAGEVVFRQSRNVDETLEAMKGKPNHHMPKPISLKIISSDQS